MRKAIPGINKSTRGRPKLHSVGVMVRIQPDLLASLDEWREKQPNPPSRPEAIRAMVAAALRLMGKD